MYLIALDIGIAMFSIALLLCLYRLVAGPTLADRILALDTLYMNSLALLIVLGIRAADPFYFDIALMIAMLGFIGTVTLASFLRRGRVID